MSGRQGLLQVGAKVGLPAAAPRRAARLLLSGQVHQEPALDQKERPRPAAAAAQALSVQETLTGRPAIYNNNINLGTGRVCVCVGERERERVRVAWNDEFQSCLTHSFQARPPQAIATTK